MQGRRLNKSVKRNKNKKKLIERKLLKQDKLPTQLPKTAENVS